MQAPVLAIDDLSTEVEISWVEPDYSGEVVSHYVISIYDKSLTTPAYTEYQSVCNGSDSVVIS